MFQTKVAARRLVFKAATGLSTVALAAGVTALGASAAQAASHAAPGLLFPPASIAVNTDRDTAGRHPA